MRISIQFILTIFSSLSLITSSLPTCHDTIPFSTKLAQSPVVIYGDIIETSYLPSLNNSTKSFNITFLVKCIFKGPLPTNENIIIEHSLPDNLNCYRTLVNGYTYVFFLNQTTIENSYKQMPYHELLFNDDTTVEILRRTCSIQTQPFHKTEKQCPIVSVGCE